MDDIDSGEDKRGRPRKHLKGARGGGVLGAGLADLGGRGGDEAIGRSRSTPQLRPIARRRT